MTMTGAPARQGCAGFGAGSAGLATGAASAGLTSPFLAFQSALCASPLRSNEIFPVIASPLTFPVNVWTNLVPFISRVTLNDTSSPVNLPSSMAISPLRPDTTPANFPSPNFSLAYTCLVPPSRAGTFHTQVPVGSTFLSSARTAITDANNRHAAVGTIKRNTRFILSSVSWFGFPPSLLLQLTARHGKLGNSSRYDGTMPR